MLLTKKSEGIPAGGPRLRRMIGAQIATMARFGTHLASPALTTSGTVPLQFAAVARSPAPSIWYVRQPRGLGAQFRPACRNPSPSNVDKEKNQRRGGADPSARKDAWRSSRSCF